MATKYGMLKAITGGVARATKDHEDTVKFLEDIKRKEEKDKIDANLKKAQTKSAEAQAQSILEKTARAKKEAEDIEAGYKNYTAGAKRAIEARQKQDEYLNKPFSLENEVPVGQEIQQIGQGDGSQITDGFQPSTPEFLSRAQFKERVDDPAKYKREQQADVTYKQKQADRLLKEEEKTEDVKMDEAFVNLEKDIIENPDRDELKTEEKLNRSLNSKFIDRTRKEQLIQKANTIREASKTAKGKSVLKIISSTMSARITALDLQDINVAGRDKKAIGKKVSSLSPQDQQKVFQTRRKRMIRDITAKGGDPTKFGFTDREMKQAGF